MPRPQQETFWSNKLPSFPCLPKTCLAARRRRFTLARGFRDFSPRLPLWLAFWRAALAKQSCPHHAGWKQGGGRGLRQDAVPKDTPPGTSSSPHTISCSSSSPGAHPAPTPSGDQPTGEGRALRFHHFSEHHGTGDQDFKGHEIPTSAPCTITQKMSEVLTYTQHGT